MELHCFRHECFWQSIVDSDVDGRYRRVAEQASPAMKPVWSGIHVDYPPSLVPIRDPALFGSTSTDFQALDNAGLNLRELDHAVLESESKGAKPRRGDPTDRSCGVSLVATIEAAESIDDNAVFRFPFSDFRMVITPSDS